MPTLAVGKHLVEHEIAPRRGAHARRRISLWHIRGMKEPLPQAVNLKDYTPPAFVIDTVDLDVSIRADDALVTAKLAVRRGAGKGADLVLDGDELHLVSLSVNGKR